MLIIRLMTVTLQKTKKRTERQTSSEGGRHPFKHHHPHIVQPPIPAKGHIRRGAAAQPAPSNMCVANRPPLAHQNWNGRGARSSPGRKEHVPPLAFTRRGGQQQRGAAAGNSA